MKKLFLIVSIFLYAILLQAQENIKVMSYNLLKFPNGTSLDRKTDLQYILNEVQPDILMVCELQNQTGANTILNYCLATPDNRYAAAAFDYNHSGSYQELNQMLYYNTQKFDLLSQSYLMTSIRDINYYELRLKTPDINNNPIYIDVYVAHFKASDSPTNKQIRQDMADVFVNHLSQIPANHYVIFGGDLNLYDSNEPAYQDLTDANNSIVMIDPIACSSSSCFWHNNTNFTAIHTQSTHTQMADDYVGGGLDDRFDFILLSENFFTSDDLYYQNNSYQTYGNNGNCFNKNINDPSCTGPYDATLRQHLYNMSDHLPVILNLETTATLSNPKAFNNLDIYFINGNIIQKQVGFTGNFEELDYVNIFDLSGKKVFAKKNYQKNEVLNLQSLKKGIYFVKLIKGNAQKTLKFVKQ